MSEASLLYEVRGPAAWFTLNRPKRRNAIDGDMLRLFHEQLDVAEADAAVRVIVLTGAGDRVFCAGADLMSAFGDVDALSGPELYARLLARLTRFPKPIIARVNGHCLAGGTGLMLAADMIYAREDATFGTPEVKVGVFPMVISPFILKAVAPKKALEMIYTGRRYSAPEADAMGLVTAVFDAEGLDASVARAVEEISANAPVAIALGRQAIAHIEELPLDEALPYLHAKLAELAATEDAAEGLGAFFEKRTPHWKGR